MPTYEYRCPLGHVTELVMPIADDKPERVTCQEPMREAITLSYIESLTPEELDELRRSTWAGEPLPEEASVGGVEFVCELDAERVWEPWAATHFHGTGGTYYEDVYRGKDGGTRYGYKRRKNAGDDLPVAGL